MDEQKEESQHIGAVVGSIEEVVSKKKSFAIPAVAIVLVIIGLAFFLLGSSDEDNDTMQVSEPIDNEKAELLEGLEATSSQELVFIAQSYEANGQYDKASQHYLDAYRQDNDIASLVHVARLSTTYDFPGNDSYYDEAYNALDSQKDQLNAQQAYYLGAYAKNSGDGNTARELLELALEKFSDGTINEELSNEENIRSMINEL